MLLIRFFIFFEMLANFVTSVELRSEGCRDKGIRPLTFGNLTLTLVPYLVKLFPKEGIFAQLPKLFCIFEGVPVRFVTCRFAARSCCHSCCLLLLRGLLPEGVARAMGVGGQRLGLL